MSLLVYLSNVGRRLSVEVLAVHSPDALKRWIAESCNIPVERQILMTVKGKNVKQQHLLSENEIFVYDKSYLTSDSDALSAPTDEPRIPEPRDYPSTLQDEQSLVAWQELFMARRTWALEIVDTVRSGVASVDRNVEECEVLERCTQVALENLQNHLLSLQQSAEKTQKWAKDVIAEHADMLNQWRDATNTLSELPIREEIASLLQAQNARLSSSVSGTMMSMLKQDDLEKNAQVLSASSDEFEMRLRDLGTSMEQLNHETSVVLKLGTEPWPALGTDGIVHEVETLATKISRDYEEVLKTPDDTKSIPLISRRAVSHTQNLLPALQQIVQEVCKMQDEAIRHREQLHRNCIQALRQISGIQSKFAGLHTQIANLKLNNEGQHSLEILDKIFRLPVAYGSTLIEAIRRSEWSERMRTDLSSLREEISQSREDETKRRKKWAASLSGFLDEGTPTSEALIDLSFSAPSNKWPFVSREEIFAYIEDLRALNINEAVEQVTQLLRDLDSSVKSRKLRPRAFKNGSVYDLGQSMLRNGDEIKNLHEDRIRLEDKLRASDSRVRKLEDLLHRQNQNPRPTSGSFTPNTDTERNTSSPGPSLSRPSEVQSRRSSMSLRRLSNQTLDEKAMVQRIVNLEGQITKLQQQAHVDRRQSAESRDKMQEAESVKQDLMANFDAQRQEFDDERQLLDDENHKLKVRLEEVEDELDRVLGSRDHQRMTQDQVITNLKADFDRLRKTSSEEIEELQSLNTKAKEDLLTHRDKVSSLERHLQQQKEDKSSLQSRNMSIASQLRTIEEQQQELILSLQAAHSTLSPSRAPPEDLKDLVRALEVVSEGASIHVRGIEDELQLAIAEKKSQEDHIASIETQLARISEQLQTARKATSSAQDELSQERSKLVTVRSELADEQVEVQNLRNKFAAGETGSGALKARLAEEEKRVAELVESSGEKEAQIEVLRKELENLTIKDQDTKTTIQALKARLVTRGRKTRELSERLFQHNDRIVRMLESFGYSITRQDDSLVVQRASKVNASTILGAEGSSPMKRTVSGSMPVQHYSEPSDLETLYWISDEDQAVEENKYQLFMRAISRLDLDTTMETVTKRYKDVETLAKKYQKDSRAYRDRSHRLQSEAHDKIAYRAFKEGDLALFLPTRNQATRPWAAFNVGAPHYFLREQDGHKLQTRDWLLARITKVEERVVDLSKSLSSTKINTDGSDAGSMRSLDENPFELSDGLRWYMIDAVEEKPGAPWTPPNLGKSTATASIVEVKGHMSRKALGGREVIDGNPVNAAKTLSKSLDSRRSSEASRKSMSIPALRKQGSGSSGMPGVAATTATSNLGEAEAQGPTTMPSINLGENDATPQGQAREDARVFEVDGQPPSREYKASTPRPSPTKRTSSTPSKKPWELFSVEYRA